MDKKITVASETAVARSRLLENRQQQPINYPVENQTLQRQGNEEYHVTVASMQGKRESMEDSHVIALNLNKHPNCALFGVFDGHGGKQTAAWVAQKFATSIDELDEFQPEKIQSKCIALDQQYFLETKDESCGCTAVFGIVNKFPPNSTIPPYYTPNTDTTKSVHVTVANMGDSRLIVGNPKTRKISVMTKDHKPALPEETQRIVDAGGFVTPNGRIGAKLAVSRAFGDHQYKNSPELPPEKQKIIAFPDITEIWISPEDIIFVCCDGIFERFSNNDAMNYIFDRIDTEPDTAKLLSDMLYEGLERGTRDNMTAMIVQLKDGSKYQKPDEFVVGTYYLMGNYVYEAAFKENVKVYGNLEFQEATKIFESRKETITEEKKRRKEKRNLAEVYQGVSEDDEGESSKSHAPANTGNDVPKRGLTSQATKGKLVLAVSAPSNGPTITSTSSAPGTISSTVPTSTTKQFKGWGRSVTLTPSTAEKSKNDADTARLAVASTNSSSTSPNILKRHKKDNSADGAKHVKKNSKEDSNPINNTDDKKSKKTKDTDGGSSPRRVTIDDGISSNSSAITSESNRKKTFGRSKSSGSGNGGKTKVSKVTTTTISVTDDSMVLTTTTKVKPKKIKKQE